MYVVPDFFWGFFMTHHTDLVLSLYRIGAIKWGDFLLKSGYSTKMYVDLRRLISHPTLLRKVANEMWKTFSSCHFDLMCGVPYTALPIATCLSLEHNIPMVMRRKEKKEYGTKQQIEGFFKPGQRCLIIEDVITTGGSIIETAQDLEAAGLSVTDTALFIDREQGGRENLENKNYTVHSVFRLNEIVQILIHSTELSSEEKDALHAI